VEVVQLDSKRTIPTVKITFSGDLPHLLKKKIRGRTNVTYHIDRRASVKDVCESLGIPHPEIDRIHVNNHDVGFDYLVKPGDSIEVIPISEKTDFFKSTLLRPIPLTAFLFIADVNVGKLARWLRLFGFDTLYKNSFGDSELAEMAGESNRILLTKDCNLLKRKKIIFGHLVRENDPVKQIVEVVKLYNLHNRIRPFTRCLRCNGMLGPVNKKEIDHLLEPLTRKYYNIFHQCNQCRQVYWHGSHRSKLDKDLQSVLSRCGI
jgi:uncharacterized protein with PIN domain